MIGRGGASSRDDQRPITAQRVRHRSIPIRCCGTIWPAEATENNGQSDAGLGKTGGQTRITAAARSFMAAAALSLASLSTPALAQDQSVLQSVLSDAGVQQHELEVVKQSAVMVVN